MTIRSLWRAWLMLAVVTAAAAFAAGQTFPPEPYPGQRGHQAPPEGWTCSPDAVDPAHECHCPGMVADPSCPMPPVEVNTCTTWCYPKSCLCAQSCDDVRRHSPAPAWAWLRRWLTLS